MNLDTMLLEVINKFYQEMRGIKNLSGSAYLSLSLSQTYYIQAISESEPVTLGDLAARMKLTKPSISGAVCKLIRKGFVLKKQSKEDKRVFYISLTPKGKEVIGADIQISNRFVDFIQKNLNEAEKEFLNGILLKILKDYK